MRISIKNFKSIDSINDYNLKPLTILSGVNSSGKSSFIQFLVLLKQTMELDSSTQPLYLDGSIYPVQNMVDLIYGKNPKDEIELEMEFNKHEISDPNGQLGIIGQLGNYKVRISVHFGMNDQEKPYISNFKIRIALSEKDENEYRFEAKHLNNDIYQITSTNQVFGLWNPEPGIEVSTAFNSFFPSYYQEMTQIDTELEDGEIKIEKRLNKVNLTIDLFKDLLGDFFKGIDYLGPIRAKPKEEYYIPRHIKKIGVYGENVARILQDGKDKKVEFLSIEETDEGIKYKRRTNTLLEATEYWLCQYFKLAKSIESDIQADAFMIYIINNNDDKIKINHVGYGISQILPIIVQGLNMSINGTLIIEQPEIHLHPKVQSRLFDFFYSLVLQKKKLVIETHSSHLISRLRRRVAEDSDNMVKDNVNLTFVEDKSFKTLELDSFGSLGHYPTDFIDSPTDELNATIKAQMKKRKNSTKK